MVGCILLLAAAATPAHAQDAKLREEIAILKAEKQALEEKVRKLTADLAKAQAVETELSKLRADIARGFNDMSERIARLEGQPTRVASGNNTPRIDDPVRPTPRVDTPTTPRIDPPATPRIDTNPRATTPTIIPNTPSTPTTPNKTPSTPPILPQPPNRTDTNPSVRADLPRIPDPVIPSAPVRTRPRTDRPKGTPTTVAMVDMVHVWNSLKEKTTIEDGLADLVYAVQFTDQTWAKKVRDLELDFALQAEGSEAWIEKKRQIEAAVIERNVAIASAKTRLNRRRGELTKLLYQKMVDGIGRVADENGYDAVIFKETEPNYSKISSIGELFTDRMVVLGTDSVDLSEQVIQLLNREYQRVGSAGN
jgi:Skp family chaperone for outer membrane proteins